MFTSLWKFQYFIQNLIYNLSLFSRYEHAFHNNYDLIKYNDFESEKILFSLEKYFSNNDIKQAFYNISLIENENTKRLLTIVCKLFQNNDSMFKNIINLIENGEICFQSISREIISDNKRHRGRLIIIFCIILCYEKTNKKLKIKDAFNFIKKNFTQCILKNGGWSNLLTKCEEDVNLYCGKNNM